MKRKLRLLFPVMIASLALSGCNFITIEDADKGGEAEVIVDPVIIDKYYNDYDLEKTGGRLIQELQKMCFDKHTKWITYGQVNSYYSKTSSHNSAEGIADGSSVNQWFYTGKEASGVGTREHVWPCANSGALWVHDNPGSGNFSPHYVDNSYYTGGGSDLYHVRTANSAVNTARGNSKFCDFDDPEYASYGSGIVEVGENKGKWNLKLYGAAQTATGAYQYADRCEPDDNMKGDVARIILYVWTHYSERGITPEGSVTTKAGNTFTYADMVGSLSLTQIMGYDNEDRCKEKLIEWNNLDKPSNVEKLRNDTVQKIQGNRNPFVDYPELVERMFS